MKITKANGKAEYALIENLKKRAGETDEKIVEIVTTILNEVKKNGDDAVREYTVRFDGGLPKKSVIEKDELQSYLDKVDDDFKNAIVNAKNNIYDFHIRQAQQSWMTTKDSGVIMGQRIRGLHRVGIYVPGGTAAYPSSVLMNAIPAKIAGVKEIIMVTPPGKDGKVYYYAMNCQTGTINGDFPFERKKALLTSVVSALFVLIFMLVGGYFS